MKYRKKMGALWRSLRRVGVAQILARIELRRRYRALQRGGTSVIPRRRRFDGWLLDAECMPNYSQDDCRVLGWKVAGNARWLLEGRPAPTAHVRDLHCLEHHYHSFAKNVSETQLLSLLATIEQREGAEQMSRAEVSNYWHPYAVSCRIANWGGPLRARLPSMESKIGERCALWADYVEWALERDILANHLLKNLWAIALYDAMASEDDVYATSLERYLSELSRQVLPDGGHYELCPMYHAKIIVDLDLLASVLENRGKLADADRLRQTEKLLRGWLQHFRRAERGWINFNDSWDDIDVGRTVFADAPGELPPSAFLRDSGFVTLQSGAMRVVMDVGGVSPAFNPGHCHSDLLSCFVLWKGVPVLVDPGALHYSPNDERMFLKSCHAHNGPCLASRDHTEQAGNFRIGRAAQINLGDVLFSPETGLVRATHQGYKTIAIQREAVVDGAMAQLIDVWRRVSVSGTEEAWLRLLFPTSFNAAEVTVVNCQAGIEWQVSSGESVKVTVVLEGAESPLLFFSEASYSDDFGRTMPATELVLRSPVGNRELKCSTRFLISPKL